MKEVYEFFDLDVDKVQELSKNFHVDVNNDEIVCDLRFRVTYPDEIQSWSKFKALTPRIGTQKKIERATVKLNSVTESGTLLTVEVVIRAPNERVR